MIKYFARYISEKHRSTGEEDFMETQAEYWNKISDEITCTTPMNLAWFEQYVSKDALVLDVGCGYGRTLAELADVGYENLVGLDSAERMITRGLREHPELDLRVSSGETIDMPDDSVDALLLFGVLTAVPFDADQETLIAEAERVLKPGGHIFVNDFCLNGDMRNMDRYFYYYEDFPDGAPYGTFVADDGGIMRHHRVDHLQSLLSRFERREEELCDWTTRTGYKSRGMAYVGRKKAPSSAA